MWRIGWLVVPSGFVRGRSGLVGVDPGVLGPGVEVGLLVGGQGFGGLLYRRGLERYTLDI